jgi:hypothetical protein
MSHKTENWQEALKRVRQGLNETKEPVVKTEDDLINEEIDSLIALIVEDGETVTEEVVEETPAEEVEVKSMSKLTEKNMLGRLAKSMDLNEENKSKLFEYFETGELEQ